jgi:hypothetical protein
MFSRFSRALAVSLATATLAVTGSLLVPAAQASGTPGAQLTGTERDRAAAGLLLPFGLPARTSLEFR